MGLRFLLSLFIICDVNGVAVDILLIGSRWFRKWGLHQKKDSSFCACVYAKVPCVACAFSFQPACYEFLGFLRFVLYCPLYDCYVTRDLLLQLFFFALGWHGFGDGFGAQIVMKNLYSIEMYTYIVKDIYHIMMATFSFFFFFFSLPTLRVLFQKIGAIGTCQP